MRKKEKISLWAAMAITAVGIIIFIAIPQYRYKVRFEEECVRIGGRFEPAKSRHDNFSCWDQNGSRLFLDYVK